MLDDEAMPTVRTTWVKERAYRAGGFWGLMMIDPCPYCGERHSHGGGSDLATAGGLRGRDEGDRR